MIVMLVIILSVVLIVMIIIPAPQLVQVALLVAPIDVLYLPIVI